MKPQTHRLIYFGLCILLGVFPQICAAQDNGMIAPQSGENGGLPPGAVYENGIVSHPISSAEENLHLLAGYYFQNPREWKRIYNENRNVISNPNRLPVGQTLQIHVGEHWKPLFSYEEWFRLANRNGQWKSGQPWKPVRSASGAPSAPPEQSTRPEKNPPASTPPKPEPTPQVAVEPEQPAPAADPEPEAPQEAPQAQAEQESPPPEETPEVTPEPETTGDEEDAAPAF